MDKRTEATFSEADWYDRNSPTWAALAELSERDPESTGHLINMWRRQVKPVRKRHI
jgi:hypothetical protein